MRFTGDNGRKPQTEARRYVYGVIATILDNGHERGRNGWFGFGEEEDKADRRLLNGALDAVRDEMVRKARGAR